MCPALFPPQPSTRVEKSLTDGAKKRFGNKLSFQNPVGTKLMVVESRQ